MDSGETYWADRAALEWQVELGVTDAIQDTPVDRYALEVAKPKPTPKPSVAQPDSPPPLAKPAEVDAIAEARKLAVGASDLQGLAAAMQ
ncbi:MAG: uracil-DNA glycosylase, partial [Pseudomonadota bacterium]